MPSRIVSLVILVYWLIAAFFLLTRDVLPELSLGYVPNLRTIAVAGKNDPDVEWTIQVVDNPKDAESRRKIGEAVTRSVVKEDGGSELRSQVSLDSANLFKGTPLAPVEVGRLKIESRYLVDPKGNLQSLDLRVSSEEAPDYVLTVEGRVLRDARDGRRSDQAVLELKFRGKDLEQTRRFPYEPMSIVGNMFGPMDRLPGLHVGQRWETGMVNPITGQLDRVRVEVVKRSLIHWGGGPVSTFEVLQSMPPLASARSWVRTDGVIVRQELPFPFMKLILEREPVTSETSKTEVTAP